SLKTTLQTDQVLAVAYEYTYGGQTYRVGEFAADHTNASEALYVKTLKNTSSNPQQANWPLMMKNVYYLASNVEKQKFRLDIKFQSDTAGVYLTYIPEQQAKDETLLKALGCDRLDNNNKAHPNGYFDFVEGYTVSNGRVFFPSVEPFGSKLRSFLVRKMNPSSEADYEKIERYVFQELYDTTRTAARQMTDKNKFLLVGQFKGSSANVISLGAYNVPQGSVVVTAGGVILTEGSDYSVDYSAGEVTILNQSIVDAGTSISVSLESDTDYGMQRKTMLGLNWEYDFSKNLQLGGTLQHLSEQALTSKVVMGSEPLNNTIWGLNMNWKTESQWLTQMLNKVPLLHCTQPSQISFTGEFAQLIAGTASGTQDNASYIDDFENAKNGIDVSEPKSWVLSSVPSMFPEHNDKDSVTSGFNRSLLAWYNIDPLFTYRSSSLTPSHIKSDLNQLSNHYVRAVYVSELYPNRDQSTYSGATNTLPILNLAYYPEERGPYNLSTDMDFNGRMANPQQRWGGMMRKLETTDFETANIDYIEFWLLDPFIYSSQQSDAADYGGDLYINLGEVSEDVLRDGKKFYESGMPVDGTSTFTRTAWGKIPIQPTQTYAFATTSGSRALQDVGLNGLNDEEERAQPAYAAFLQGINVNDSLRAAWNQDPANDNYHYFRGSDYDERKTSILDRYKRINMPQGNSPDSGQQTESYDTSYKTTPDVEDINQDYTLNEYERYYQYHVSLRPEDMQLGQNFITDIREYTASLRNGEKERVRWYQFRIPLTQYESREGGISDFTSIRFMRMFLTQFRKPIVLRFGSLDLVRGEWRVYQQQLTAGAASGTMEVSAVNIEENNDRQPVNYVLPPGITRVQDPSQPQLTEANEQALCMVVKNLAAGESKAVYRNTTLDLRQYRNLQMYVHANHLISDATGLADDQLAVFVRLGSDYKNNYYEYLIPLKLTPDSSEYNKYNLDDCRDVWPQDNMLDIDLSVFTRVKKARN
ncbi:MAG: cell surface protein SprA, partial [Prevotella sp.]|nr:cell surface protein SprA [Prevotella sp.]